MAPPLVENDRSRLDLYGYLEDGGAFEIRRRGRLDVAPAVFRVGCVDGEVGVTDPRADAFARRAAKGEGM